MLNPPRRTLHLPGLDLSYLDWSGGSEPVLLLHGMADHGGVWVSLAESLGDRYHCVAPDLRGHGDSGKPVQGYRCGDMIADLKALMAHLNWTSAHVIAHSWAAKIATVWAREQPERIRSLVLVDPFFIGSMPDWMQLTFPFLYRVLPFLQLMRSFSSYEQAEQVARQLKQYRGWSPLQQWVFQTAIEQKPEGYWSSKFVRQARDQIFEDVMRVDGLTEPLAVSTLLIQPKQGLNRTNWQLQPYRRYLKHLTIQQVPGNHWCFLVEPDAFNQAIATFLFQQSNPATNHTPS
jgi:pimeloyl-ACP methyl ester carboxylesterase